MKRRRVIAIIAIALIASVGLSALSRVLFSFATEIILEAVDRSWTNKAQIAYDEAKKKEHDDLVPFSVLDSSSDPPKQMVEGLQYNGKTYTKVDLTNCFWRFDWEKLEKCGTVLTVVWRLGYVYSYDPVYFISDLDGNPILFYIYNVDLMCCYVDNLDLSYSIDETTVDLTIGNITKTGITLSGISSSVQEYSQNQYRRKKVLYRCDVSDVINKSNEGYIVGLPDLTVNFARSEAAFLKSSNASVVVLFETYYIKLYVDYKFYLLEIDDVDFSNEIDVYLGVSG